MLSRLFSRNTYFAIQQAHLPLFWLPAKQVNDVTPSTALVPLRFALASDKHLREPPTTSDQFYTDLTAALTQAHKTFSLQFVVMNGNLLHEGSTGLLLKTNMYLGQLPVSYYVTRGNHDRVSVDT